MPDNKLTDNEIKICQNCIHYDICIFHIKGSEAEKCVNYFDKDLINRLQAENERLKEENKILDLNRRMALLEKEPLYDKIKTAKAEAYKEFEKMLHEELRMYGIKDKFNKAVFLNIVDKAKKELVGDKK